MPEDAKDLLRRFYAEMSAGNLDAIDEVVVDSFIEHESFPGIEPNKEGVRQFFQMFRSAFPDMKMEAHEIVGEGDLLCVRGTMSGTHQGEFMGMPPTGKSFEVHGVDIVRFGDDGVGREHWGVFDTMSMLQQLGVVPAPEGAPA
jgi:steroid delta-isomerase-like uncharacterized protein